ncbi:HU family DNA-binding protein [Fluviicola sp. SGL-29]|nr:HU family DNA-binding protein [Fluviicola sp. SGL-29]
MNKSEFIRAIAEKSGNSQAETKRFLEAFTATVEETLAEGQKITLAGFGTWDIQHVAARIGRNPQTGKSLTIPAKKKVRFKAGSELAGNISKK